jgi:predicted RNA-binding Zn-ribbon protein involved in translation (DUF1610 family)
MVDNVKAKCQHCGSELDPSHIGPCPSCGKTGKEVIVTVNSTVRLKTAVSKEQTSAYFEWLNIRVDVNFIALTAVWVIALVVTAAIGSITGDTFKALLGALISFVVSYALGYFAIMFLIRYAKKIAARSISIELKPEEAKLWNTAVHSANKFRAFRFALSGSTFIVIFFTFVVWFYTAQHIWKLQEGLDYAAIVLIAWAGIVHLSDRLFINKSATIASCTNSNEVNINRLIELVAKRRLGLISASFLALGFMCEIARFILEKTQS